MCGSVLSEYLKTGNEKDERFLDTIYVRKNMLSSSEIEVLCYTIKIFLEIYILL